MKMNQTVLFLALSVCMMLSTEVSGVALPPFMYTGRIVNYENGNLADTTSGAEIRARKNGELLARSPILKVEGTANNYRLSIPLSTEESATAARPGDVLTFEIDLNTDANGVIQATNSFVAVGAPGRVAHVNICAAEDSDGDGVSDPYSSMITSLMRVNGITGAYDSQADYDGDGLSNYEEYLAGTNPFSIEDALRILTFENVPDNEDLLKITFLPGRMRAYTIQESTNSIARTYFRSKSFRLDRTRDAAEYSFLQTGTEYDEVRTLYLLKNNTGTGFYRLRLE